MNTALIVGGSGLVGGHLVKQLQREGGWRVISTQRRLPAAPPIGVTPLALDVCDETSVGRALAGLAGVTHVFFLARVWDEGYVIGREQNVAALARVLDAIQDWPTLRHVQLVHGLKWYGSVEGPFPTPARESDPRPGKAHFYFDQRDLLAQRQQGRGWHWATLRPHCVSGVAVGSPSNVMLGMGVYAAVMRALGRPLAFPASQAAFDARLTYTDAGLLARAMAWAATAPAARDEDFNVANGDTFSWRNVWPAIAEAFGMRAAPPQPISLAEEMPRHRSVWARLAEAGGLAQPDIGKLVDWHFMDATLALQWDQTMSLEKLRARGFVAQVESRGMILDILRQYRQCRVLPAADPS